MAEESEKKDKNLGNEAVLSETATGAEVYRTWVWMLYNRFTSSLTDSQTGWEGRLNRVTKRESTGSNQGWETGRKNPKGPRTFRNKGISNEIRQNQEKGGQEGR